MATMADILSYAERVGQAALPAKYILEDPALPQVAWQVSRLHALEQKSTNDVGTSKEVPGIGLKYLITPLKAYTALRASRLHPYIILGAIAGGFILVGYYLGKKKK